LAAEVRRLFRHWELKLAALALAFALWVFVMTSEKADLVLAAAVELDGIPAGLMLVGDRPDSVDVQLHGLRAILARVGPEHVRARVNLAGARPGEVVVRLVPDQIDVPSGVTVLRVSPSRLRVTLEAKRAEVRP
jgi:YbbR domain-containing protein